MSLYEVNANKKYLFRYWDWAADARIPDFVLKDETIEVETANGKQRIRNPLYSHNFGSIDRREFPVSSSRSDTPLS